MIDIKKRIVFFFLIVGLYPCVGFAQDSIPISFLRPGQLKSMGMSAKIQGDAYSAIVFFERYLKLKPGNHKIEYELAECFRMSRDYENAAIQYKAAYTGDPQKYTKGMFYHGVMLKANSQYDKAKESLLKFKKEYKGHKDARVFAKLAASEIRGCERSTAFRDSMPIKVIISHLDTSINKAHVEFSPLPISDSSFIYASLKTELNESYKTTENLTEEDSLNKPYRKFYTAALKKGEWVTSGELGSPFNIPNVNTGNGAISPDGKRFYFTRCVTNWENKVICSIFRSTLKDGQWQEAEDLGKEVNNPKYTSTQPAVGVESRKGADNRELLYFVSDRKGGKGGLDIWYTIFDPKLKKFKTPRNAGPLVNTPGNEMTPSYDMSSRSLYFSSDGWPGLGNLDVFKLTGELNKWTTATNIGAPINSGADDIYFTIGKNREQGFFVSNRKGGIALNNATCCDDIYSYRYTKYIHLAMRAKTAELSEKNIAMKLQNADVSLYLIDKNFDGPLLLNKLNSENPAEVVFNLEPDKKYKLISNKEGYLSTSYEFSTIGMNVSDTLTQQLLLSKMPKGPIVVKNIHYDFNKATLTPDAKTTLDTTILKMMLENPLIIIEIGAHTDSKGDDKYNMTLSQKRAESVVNYLLAKGINKQRLIAKGYGESKPVAPNQNPDGSDNPEGRDKNRRTEFIVIGKIDQDIIYEDN